MALLAEMDALPAIGHACGHNLSGPASLLAAQAVASALPADAVRLLVQRGDVKFFMAVPAAED